MHPDPPSPAALDVLRAFRAGDDAPPADELRARLTSRWGAGWRGFGAAVHEAHARDLVRIFELDDPTPRPASSPIPKVLHVALTERGRAYLAANPPPLPRDLYKMYD